MNQELFDNCIIIGGLVHTLTKQSDKSEDGWTNNPCELCSLKEVCQQQEGHLCSYLDASQEEYFIQNAITVRRVVIDLYNI